MDQIYHRINIFFSIFYHKHHVIHPLLDFTKILSQQLNQMGNTNQQIQKQLIYIQKLEDKHFGPVDIFKSDSLFIMKLDRNYIKGDLQQKNVQKIITYTLSKQVKHIIPIVHIHKHKQNGFCLAYECISVYTEYYNHTLSDMLSCKKVFEEGELWLILHNMLNLIFHLKFNQLAINLNLNNIFLTLKGLPLVSHHQIVSTENSVSCCQAGMGQLLAKVIIELFLQKSLEQCGQMHQLEGEQYLGKLMKKYKLLGKVIKQLLTKQKDEKEVLDQIQKWQIIKKIPMASQVKLTKFKYIIPDSHVQTSQQYNKMAMRQSTPVKKTEEKDQKTHKIIELGKDKDKIMKGGFSSDKRKNSTATTIKNDHCEKQSLKNFVNKSKVLVGKDQSSKMLNDIEKKKKEYQKQMEKFKMRKEELLSYSQKQNLANSRPVLRDTDCKKTKARSQFESHGKKKTQPSTNYKYR